MKTLNGFLTLYGGDAVDLDYIERAAVLEAIDEYDRLGEIRFLKKYGFGPATKYWIVQNGKYYASKAILGVAYRSVDPKRRPLSAKSNLHGGDMIVRRLKDLGFSVSAGQLTSAKLKLGNVYTRDDLKVLFENSDATINNGIFKPKGTASVWLFVTEVKTSDRTQYQNRLEGNFLHMQGQSAGRTDKLIIDHVMLGLELLLFFRRSRQEHPGAGFQYLGPFSYISHSGARPSSFVLERSIDAHIRGDEAASAPFEPENSTDARNRIQRAIVERRGQQAFRNGLLRAYDERCAISGCDTLDVLEAAHICPYRGEHTNDITNGLLLRADLHTLFDCGLIAINPETFRIALAPRLQTSEYGKWHEKPLRLPANPEMRPSKEALKAHLRDSIVATPVAQNC